MFVDAAPITIGQSLRCRLSIPADGLPAEHVLFARDQGRLLLRPASAMTGRIAQGDDAPAIGADEPGRGGRMVDLGEPARPIPIARGARGKLRLGEVTILFQEVAAPPVPPRPRLPASVRGSLADRVDPRLAAILGLSLCTHLAIAAWAWLEDADTGSMFSPRISAEHYRPEVIDITLPDDPPPAPPGTPDGPGAAAPVSPRQTARPIVPRPGRPDEPGLSAADAERYAQVLTGGDETARGTGGDLRGRQPQGDLKQQIDDIRDHDRGVEVGRDPRSRDAGTRVGTIPDRPRIEDPQQVARRTDDRERTQPRIDLVPPRPPRGPRPEHGLTPEAVVEKIRTTYLPGLQRCYQQGLLHDAALKGKIQLAFTVDEKGHLTEAEAHGLTPAVDACVAGQMAGWRFGIPRDGDRQPTEATFQLGLVLAGI